MQASLDLFQLQCNAQQMFGDAQHGKQRLGTKTHDTKQVQVLVFLQCSFS